MIEGIGIILGIKDLLNNFYNYFKPGLFHVKRRLEGRTHSFDMENWELIDYWNNILGTKFYNIFPEKRSNILQNQISIGDYVVLENADIIQWTPAFPGKFFSTEGIKVIEEFKKEFPENHEYGLEEELLERYNSIVLQGAANLRFLSMNNTYLISATNKIADFGIPLLVSEKLYTEKLEYEFGRESTLTGRVEGVICEIPGEWKNRIIQAAPNDYFMKVYNLPHYVLRVEKIKSIGSGKSVFGNVWTIYKEAKHSEFILLKNAIIEINKENESIENAVKKLLEYAALLRSPLVGGDFQPILNFDERRNWFGGKTIKESDSDGGKEFSRFWIDLG